MKCEIKWLWNEVLWCPGILQGTSEDEAKMFTCPIPCTQQQLQLKKNYQTVKSSKIFVLSPLQHVHIYSKFVCFKHNATEDLFPNDDKRQEMQNVKLMYALSML